MLNKSAIATILGTTLLGLMKSRGNANLSENENSWGIRLAMLKGFLALDKQERERIMPPDMESPRSLYDNQEYGAPHFNEMSDEEVSSHLRHCWLDDFNEDSYPWQTLITQKDEEIQFWEFWSSECFEGLKTKPRYSRFMQGHISNWDIGKIIEVFDNDFNSILSPLGYEVSKTEIIPLRTEFISITYIKRLKNGSKSFIDPNKVQSSIDVDFTFTVNGEGYLGYEDEDIVSTTDSAKGRFASIVKYSRKWQEQMTQIKDEDLTVGDINLFFANNHSESQHDYAFVDDFMAVGNDMGLDYVMESIFVLKNLLGFTNFKLISADLDEYSITMSASVKIKLMDSKSIRSLLKSIVQMITWTGGADYYDVEKFLIDPDNKMNEETKKIVVGFSDSELRRF
jgi:hypothetical protein